MSRIPYEMEKKKSNVTQFAFISFWFKKKSIYMNRFIVHTKGGKNPLISVHMVTSVLEYQRTFTFCIIYFRSARILKIMSMHDLCDQKRK